MDDVRQVELALGVVAAQARQRGTQRLAAEHVEADIDLVDLPLLVRRVLELDDADHAAVLVTHDAPVVGRIGEASGRERRRGRAVVVPLQKTGDELGVHQRHVSVQDHHVTVEPLQGSETGAHRVSVPRRSCCTARSQPTGRMATISS